MTTSYPLNLGVSLLINGDQAYPSMLAAIDSAEKSVNLAVYHFDDDLIGRRFLRALERAHQRGVEVRVIVDAVGALVARPSLKNQLIRSAISAKVFAPLARFWNVNCRYHRKLITVDDEVAFVGGMNLRQCHVEPRGDEYKHYPDYSMRLTGPVVHALSAVFEADWMGESQPSDHNLAFDSWGLEVLLGAGWGDSYLAGRYRDLMLAARHEVWICTPYLLPPDSLLEAVRSLRERQVRVCFVADSMRKRIFRIPRRARVSELLALGCEIWFSYDDLEHGKVLLVDSEVALVGSVNFDARSLYRNLEIGIVVRRNDRFLAELKHSLTEKADRYVQLRQEGEFRRANGWSRMYDRIVSGLLLPHI